MKWHVRIHPSVSLLNEGWWDIVAFDGRGQWQGMATRKGKHAALELKREWERNNRRVMRAKGRRR